MERRLSSYTGCLLGLAAGDGLGHGRLNGFLSVSAYTQLAAYGCNGLLLGLTRQRLCGAAAPPVRWVARALEEWARGQLWRRERTWCGISRSDRLDYRRCPEPELLDVLAAGEPGIRENHAKRLSGPGALMTAPAVGLYFDPERLSRRELYRLGAEAAALTHTAPAAFLSAAALTHILSRVLWDGETDLEKLTREAEVLPFRRLGRAYHQVWFVRSALKRARSLARSRPPAEALSRFSPDKAHNVLAGALYCCMSCGGDAARAMETAARWSPAGAAVTGAVLGAAYGEEALPKPWLEELECAGVLRELARDLFGGCPMAAKGGAFDIEWDEKYGAAEE